MVASSCTAGTGILIGIKRLRRSYRHDNETRGRAFRSAKLHWAWKPAEFPLLACLAEHDPRRRVIACAVLAAHLAVDACVFQTRGKLGAEQEMVEPQARIARPAVSFVVPEGVHRLLRVDVANRVRPALLEERGKRGAALWLDQSILVP